MRSRSTHPFPRRVAASFNMTPEATAVGSTGCVASVLRRFGYSRRASAPCWASSCGDGVAVFARHAVVCPTPTPLSDPDTLADALGLEIESAAVS